MDNCNVNRWQQLKTRLRNLSPEDFKSAIESQPGAILIDCRTPGEFAFSRLPAAVNFNYLSQNFVEEMEKMDPEAIYLVYCRSERRSLRTCTLLQNGGFKNVYNLDGGLVSWLEKFGEESLDRTQLS